MCAKQKLLNSLFTALIVASFALLAAIVLSVRPSHAREFDTHAISIHGFVGSDEIPFLGSITLNLTARATAGGAGELTGFGSWIATAGNFPGNGEPGPSFLFLESSNFEIQSGSVSGDSVILQGVATRSIGSFVVGLPVLIEASTTGHIAVYHGPFETGPFLGMIFELTGRGQVHITSAP